MIARFFQKLKWLLIRRKYILTESTWQYWDAEYRQMPESQREKIQFSIMAHRKGNVLLGYVAHSLRDGRKILFCIKTKDCKKQNFELINANMIKKYDSFYVNEYHRG